MTIFLRVCLCFLVRLTKISQSGFWRSLKATARWWFSRTDSSLYMMASSELVLIRNWFVSPGWSTSWMAAAKMADITSRGVKTHCDGELAFCEEYCEVTSSAGELRRTWVDCVTSAPWTLLWYGTSEQWSEIITPEESQTIQQYLVNSGPPEFGGNSETLSRGSWKF